MTYIARIDAVETAKDGTITVQYTAATAPLTQITVHIPASRR